MKEIRPAVESTRTKHPDLKGNDLENAAIEENVRRSMAAVLKSPKIKKAVDEKSLKIVGAIRDLKSGKVRWLD